MTSTLSSDSDARLEARSEATRVTLIGMLLDIALGVSKILGGMLSSSFALIADGVHSLTDAATDVFVLAMARIAYARPDRGHPYGHGRFEALGTIIMGIVFFITAGVLLYGAGIRLAALDTLALPTLAGAAVAALSIASKEWIYRYTLAVADRLNSSLLRANAWHSRSDALSSVAVLIGILGAQAGLVWLDTLAAVVVALLIAKIGWDLCAESLSELVDGAVSEEERTDIETCLRETKGVLGITDLRTRLSGGKAIVEVHLVVDPRISVSEGHQIGALAVSRLKNAFARVNDVIPHIDPLGNSEHDLSSEEVRSTPSREEVQALILETSDGRDLDFDLHYFTEGVEVDLILRHEDDEASARAIAQALHALSSTRCVRILRHIESLGDHAPDPR